MMFEKVGLGGGCHWCTEAVFAALKGVSRVEQGFASAPPPQDAWSEAVIVHFDPEVIGLDTLIAVHIETHSAFANHSMRGKYRSAVYAVDETQATAAREALAGIVSEDGRRPVTQLLDLADFKPSATRFHDYYATDPERPFCKAYISPKLARLRATHGRHVKED